MKITQLLFAITFCFFSLHFGTNDSNAQQVREMQPLEALDFECLQSLECVQSSQSLKSKGWSFIFDETVDEYARELTAIMKSENIFFFAIYDHEGYVIRSDYKRNNSALPLCLLAYLAEGDYKGWQITGSELEIRDFDPATVKYKVILENKTSAKSEVYDYDFIESLHLKHEDLAQHDLF
jgi:hypothetical protein